MEDQTKRLAEVHALRTQGIIYAKGWRNEQAEALYWQAFRLHEEVLGPDDPAIAESLNQIVFFSGTQWRRSEAEPLVERSLALLRRKPRPEHRGILQTLDSLASHSCSLAHYADAEWYYEQVLEARQELLGPDHPRTTGTIEKRAATIRQRQKAEADT